MINKQPEALRLADMCKMGHSYDVDLFACSAELRRQHARILELEAQLAAAQQAVQDAVPLFWVRLLRDGLYEGPIHNNSVGGKMLRDEKPGEWHPLYLHAAHAHPAEGVPAQAEPFMWAIQGPSGRAFIDEGCVSTLWENVRAEVDSLNSELDVDDEPFKVVPVYLAATQPAAQGMDAMNQAIEAMQLALSSHGVQLLSYPPQDAWSSRRVDEKLRTAISALAAQAKQGGAA